MKIIVEVSEEEIRKLVANYVQSKIPAETAQIVRYDVEIQTRSGKPDSPWSKRRRPFRAVVEKNI